MNFGLMVLFVLGSEGRVASKPKDVCATNGWRLMAGDKGSFCEQG